MDLYKCQTVKKENYTLSIDLSEGHTNSGGHTKAHSPSAVINMNTHTNTKQ